MVEREISTDEKLGQTLARSHQAFVIWKLISLRDRIAIAERFLSEMAVAREDMSRDLSRQMGRPIAHCNVEVDGTIARGRHMISLAPAALADSMNEASDISSRWPLIKRRRPIRPTVNATSSDAQSVRFLSSPLGTILIFAKSTLFSPPSSLETLYF